MQTRAHAYCCMPMHTHACMLMHARRKLLCTATYCSVGLYGSCVLYCMLYNVSYLANYVLRIACAVKCVVTGRRADIHRILAPAIYGLECPPASCASHDDTTASRCEEILLPQSKSLVLTVYLMYCVLGISDMHDTNAPRAQPRPPIACLPACAPAYT